MSTKIYNAYVMERKPPKDCTTTWHTIKDIDKNLRSIMKRAMPRILKYARKQLSERMIEVHDEIVLNHLKLEPYDLNSSVYSYACRSLDKEYAKAARAGTKSHLDFYLEASLFTHKDGSPAAIMFFGHRIWLDYIYKNAHKFGLKDYHYQNSTDKPKSVSKREWEARERFWDKVAPSGVPFEDGYSRQIFKPPYSFFSDLDYKASDWQRDRTSFERRVQYRANDRASYLYLRDTKPGLDHCRQMFSAASLALSEEDDRRDQPLYQQYVQECAERYERLFSPYKTISFKHLQSPVGDLLPDSNGPKDPRDWVGSMVKVTMVDGEVPIHGYVSAYEDSSRGKYLLVKSDRWADVHAFAVGSDQVSWEKY